MADTDARLFLLRTGRFELSRTFLDSSGRPGEHDFADENDAAFDVDHHVRRRQLVAGTAWTVIFPMDDTLVAGVEDSASDRRAALAGSRR